MFATEDLLDDLDYYAKTDSDRRRSYRIEIAAKVIRAFQGYYLTTQAAVDGKPLPPETGGVQPVPTYSTLADTKRESEKLLIQRVLKDVGHNRSAAARTLGISRTAMYKKLRKHKLCGLGE